MVSNNTITKFSDIKEQYLNWLYSICNNIDAYSASVPAAAKTGSVTTISIPINNQPRGANLALRWDTVIPVVTKATVQQQLNDFLSSRGISSKSNKQMTLSSMMNLYNNLAAFTAVKVVCAGGLLVNPPIYMYKSTNTGFNAVSISVDNLHPSDSEILLTQSEILANAIKATRQHQYIYDVSCFCCSSSSSSSSTSCSSCHFIAYIRGLINAI